MFWDGHKHLNQSSTIFTLLVLASKKSGKSFQIFVVFSECSNFTQQISMQLGDSIKICWPSLTRWTLLVIWFVRLHGSYEREMLNFFAVECNQIFQKWFWILLLIKRLLLKNMSGSSSVLFGNVILKSKGFKKALVESCRDPKNVANIWILAWTEHKV